MKNLFSNWKTTSAGLVMIIGSVIHVIFAVRSGTATEGVWTASVTAIVAGLGLIFAGDATKGKQELEAAKEEVKTAIETGDSSHITQSEPKV